MDGRSSPILVTLGLGVSLPRSKITKSIIRSTLVSRLRQTSTTVADHVCCEQQAAAWSVTTGVVNYLCFAVIGDRHVGIYASPYNWRTCYPHMPIGMLWIYRLLFVCLFFCLSAGILVTVFSGMGGHRAMKFCMEHGGRSRSPDHPDHLPFW